ncbi:beta-galactosidase-1-like protein 2 [Diorhabda carinulata]|uniref:beta-galactosidase-1-like protein 2 n=1 Tax=Diorhabda carinulata TaxID=1163345 RepID=UPI0025A30707|nr:beta-galactosidase-1-like protein 2 [Diorhabda carinulata]
MAVAPTTLPTLYEYYTGNGISAGLSDQQPYFTLNNKNITLYSGAFHYFRMPRGHWRDRLRKMRAAGLNAVATYIPWNLHEPQEGVFDFGSGGTDFEDFLHLEEFLRTAKEEDLFVLVRPGPYINSEFDFGGLPSWITKTVKTVRRSTDEYFLKHVRNYFNVLMPILALLQFQKGGPIIGVQIENEYGSKHVHDTDYLQALKDMMTDNGISELFFTSDPPRNGQYGAIPGVLQMANFNGDPKEMFDLLNTFQHNKPNMAMESYTGWFDHWTENHHHKRPSEYQTQLQNILDYPGSVNMYMFIGSTSYGFTSGATLYKDNDNSGYQPDTTSYDYDSPVTEHGTTTSKYDLIKQVIASHNQVQTSLPELPDIKPLVAYGTLTPIGQLPISEAINQVGYKIDSQNIVPMEKLDINNGNGQSFGYIIYRKINIDIPANAELKIFGYVRDTVLVLINGQLVSPAPTSADDLNGFGFWKVPDTTLTLTTTEIKGATLELIVENFGRSAAAAFSFKGLTGDVLINNEVLYNWEIVPLEFRKSYNLALYNWQSVTQRSNNAALYKFNLHIDGEPSDTYLDMRKWTKGITIVNGFVLGRHFFVGPQQTLYLAAPLLRSGDNDIIVFEHYNAPDALSFLTEPIFEVPTDNN